MLIMVWWYSIMSTFITAQLKNIVPIAAPFALLVSEIYISASMYSANSVLVIPCRLRTPYSPNVSVFVLKYMKMRA